MVVSTVFLSTLKMKGYLLKVLQIRRQYFQLSVKKSAAISSQVHRGCLLLSWIAALGPLLNACWASIDVLSDISIYARTVQRILSTILHFTIPTCPSWRSLRHLSCGSGAMHNYEPFRMSSLLINTSFQAPQNC